jgi:two-component system heavy metal sensor histidine kinase CusS
MKTYSLQLKLIAFFSIILLALFAVFGYIMYNNMYNNLLARVDGSLKVILSDMTHDAYETQGHINLEEVDEDLLAIKSKWSMKNLYVRYLTYDTQHKEETLLRRFGESEAFPNIVWPQFHNENNVTEDQLRSLPLYYHDYNHHRVATQIIQRGAHHYLAIECSVYIGNQQSLTQTKWLIIIIETLLFLSVIGGAYLLIRQTLSSVQKVVKSVQAISSYDYDKRIPYQGIPSEIQSLVQTFNNLLERHKQSYQKILQFSSDASHELRTPLTILRGEIEVLLRKERSVHEYQNGISSALDEIIRIQNMIDDLLFLAKTDAETIRNDFTEVYLDEIVVDCKTTLEYEAQKKSITIDVSVLYPLSIEGNTSLLQLACINLLNNAIIYSPEHTTITMGIDKAEEQFVLFIEDEGYGMDEYTLSHLFDRFYRGEATRQKNQKGSGLGLAIVKMILETHYLSIRYMSTPNKGTRVEIFS